MRVRNMLESKQSASVNLGTLPVEWYIKKSIPTQTHHLPHILLAQFLLASQFVWESMHLLFLCRNQSFLCIFRGVSASRMLVLWCLNYPHVVRKWSHLCCFCFLFRIPWTCAAGRICTKHMWTMLDAILSLTLAYPCEDCQRLSTLDFHRR